MGFQRREAIRLIKAFWCTVVDSAVSIDLLEVDVKQKYFTLVIDTTVILKKGVR